MKFDYVKALVAAHYEHDEARFEATVRQIISVGPGAARHLDRYLALRHSGVVLMQSQREYWTPARPQVMSDLILPEFTMHQLAWVLEQRKRAEELRANDLSPCARLLLHGGPGTGKTMAACCMANELGLPALILRSEAVVESYLGKSAQNLRQAIEAVSQVDAVFIIDEVDSIGATRNNDTSSGQEMSRMTNALLSLLDTTSDRCLLVATTNRFDLLDPALTRRWRQLAIAPTAAERKRMWEREGLVWSQDIAKTCDEWSMAELAARLDEAKRLACLHQLPVEDAFDQLV